MNLPEINFEQAKLLKQAGFVEHTTKFYDKNGVLTGSLPINHNLHKDRFSCCSIALAFMWLREVKNIYCWVAPKDREDGAFDISIFDYKIFHAEGKFTIQNSHTDFVEINEGMLTDALKLTRFYDSNKINISLSPNDKPEDLGIKTEIVETPNGAFEIIKH